MVVMVSDFLESRGGERHCPVCGFEEREIFRLFCPCCMKRDRLTTLISMKTPSDAVSLPADLSSDGELPGISS